MAARVQERITDMAAGQQGLVTRAQLLGAGLSPDQVKHLMETRQLRPIHRGVYRVGPLVATWSREMAAVLACGPGTVLSHRSAAALWRLLPPGDASRPVDVTQSGGRSRRAGIRAYRHRLEDDEVTSVDRVPVTAPPRTLLDLSGVVGRRKLERALATAERKGLVTVDAVRSVLERHPARRGSAQFRAVLAAAIGPRFLRSKAEELFLELVRKARLPEPLANVTVAGYEVDFFWPAERLVVEVDGFAFHSSRSHFESDRDKGRALAARGILVIRVTWRQMTKEPVATMVQLGQALAARSPQ